MAIVVNKLFSTDKILTPEELSLVGNREMNRNFTPDDFIELHVYNNTNNLLKSVVPFNNYQVPNNGVTNDVNSIQEITFDPAIDIQTLGFYRGEYIVDYNILRPKIYSSYERLLFIKEISDNRLELRLASTTLTNIDISNGGSLFISEFENSPYFKEFYLNFGQNQFIPAVNIALDLNTANYTILIKLIDPLPVNFNVNDKVSIVDKLSIDDRFSVSITSEIPTPTIPTLRPANFNIEVDSIVAGSTPYYNYSQLTNITSSQNSTLQKLINFVSSSNFQINVDYTNYDNFVKFSSAAIRLETFQYKVGQIENYNELIYSASQSPSSTALLDATSSLNSINKIIQGFDGYENYLYFETGSYSWPKSTSTQPYQLYSVSSSQVITWYSASYASSSVYDDNNRNYLINALPTYVSENSSNGELFKYVGALGQMFDEIWLYIKSIVDLYQAKNSLDQGISKDLVYYALQSFGIKVYTDEDGTEVFDYLYGVNPNGSYLPVTSSYQTLISASQYQTPGQDQIKSFYKRIYNNLPTLLKSKGTNKFADYLSTLYGISNTILRPLEFGGVDKNEETIEYSFNRFTYAAQVSGSQYFYTPWTTLSSSFIDGVYNDNSINAFEFRFKPFEGSTIANTQSLATIRDFNTNNDPIIGVTLTKYTTGSFDYGIIKVLIDNAGGGSTTAYQEIELDPLPIFVTNSLGEYNWYNVLVQRNLLTSDPYVTSGYVNTGYVSDPNGDYNYTIYVKNEIGGEIGHQSSGSFQNDINNNYIDVAWSGSTTKQLVLGGFDTTPNSSDFGVNFSGSLQEFRLWGTTISESKFNHHTLNPESFEGDNTGSAYNNLIGRFPLGNDLYTYNHYNTTKVYGVQPNLSMAYSSSAYSTSSYISASGFDNFTNYSYFTETYYTNPAISTYTSPVTSKIDIVSGSVYGDILTLNKSIVQKPILKSTTDTHLYQFGFSPQDEINEDIIAQLGTTYNIDNLIGNPSEANSPTYEQLDLLQAEYFKKYQNKYNYKDFETLIDYFHNSLFKFIQDFVPGRSNTATGLIYKPHILERSKQARYEPTYTNPYYTGSFEVEEFSGGYGGAMPDIRVSSSIFNLSTGTGSVQVIGDNKYAYNGELSGSIVDVNDYYQFYNPAALPQNIVTIYQTGSLGTTVATVDSLYTLLIPYNIDPNQYYLLSFDYSSLDIGDSIYIKDSDGNILYTLTRGASDPSSGTITQVELLLTSSPPIGFSTTDVGGVPITNLKLEIYGPLNNEPYGGFEALNNNVEENRISDLVKLVSYNENGTVVTSSVQLQDALYTSTLSIPRITGTKTTSQAYNEYTNGDITYGLNSAIDQRQSYFAFSDWNGNTLAERFGSSNYHIKYLIDEDGNVFKPQYSSSYYYNTDQNFGAYTDVNIAVYNGSGSISQDYDTTSYIPLKRFRPIIFTDTGSQGNTFLVNGTLPTMSFNLDPGATAVLPSFGAKVDSSIYSGIFDTIQNNYNLPVRAQLGTFTLDVVYDYASGFASTYGIGGTNVISRYISQFDSPALAVITASVYLENLGSGTTINPKVELRKNANVLATSFNALPQSAGKVKRTLYAITDIRANDNFFVDITNTTNEGSTADLQYSSASLQIDPDFTTSNIAKSQTWTTGSNTGTHPFVLTGSSILTSIYGPNVQDPLTTGFGEPLNFTIQKYDEFRFEGDENKVYRVIDSYISASNLYVTLDTPIQLDSFTDIQYFVIRRLVDDPGFIIINNNPSRLPSPGPAFIIPKYPSEKLKNNLPQIIENLSSKGLI